MLKTVTVLYVVSLLFLGIAQSIAAESKYLAAEKEQEQKVILPGEVPSITQSSTPAQQSLLAPGETTSSFRSASKP